jgi:uncharacterized phage protein (TIGR01671 family)
MRTIKFRAWDKKNKSMEYDITGFECNDLGIDGVFIDGDYHSLRDTELMQFTGLLDKNGKEIYEGDIVKQLDSIYVIEWGNAGFDAIRQCCLGCGTKTTYLISVLSDGHYTIIGNIWDNPELIGMSEPPKAERR